MTLTLDSLRTKVARAIGAFLWLHVPVVVGVALLRGTPVLLVALAVAALAGLVEVSTVRRPGATSGHVVLAFAYAAIIAILVGQMQGHPWQTDMHMYFFAALAIVAALCSWPAILAFLGFVAVHHLALNALQTNLVFGGPADLARVLVHAVILIVEATVLGGLTFVLAQMFGRSQAEMASVQTAHGKAETLLAERAVAQAAQDQFLTALVARITEIAAGAFGRQIPTGAFPVEYDGVRQSLNLLSTRLHHALETVADAAAGIQNAGAVLAAASQTLQTGSRDQVATLEAATESFRALLVSLTSTAQLARQADSLMLENRSEVERGTGLLAEVVAAMGLIEESTGQIRQIVEVMDNIAFQTNLLALNAGVEAARAGDSGRGFAVVAMEVRALAQRAAESAREIRGLIDQGQGNVALGTQKVSLTTAALRGLQSSASRAAGYVSDIAAKVQAQTKDLEGVHAAVSGLDGQAQRNAALAARIADAGGDLGQYSSDLALGMEEIGGGSGFDGQSATAAPARVA